MGPPVEQQQRENQPDQNWTYAFRALGSRNFRLYIIGQGISLIGTWMTRLATGWLVYRLTGSEALLGIVSFAGQIPIFLLSPMAGVWVDRWNLHRALLLTQVLAMVQSLALAVLILTDTVQMWHVIVLSLFQGVINAFDMPVRQAFVVQMVDDRQYLSNAIALNSSMVNASRLIGPSIAGLIIAALGEGICFLVDGLSYLAVILSVVMMRVGIRAERPAHRPVFEELKEGWDYITGSVPIRSIILLICIMSLMGMPYSVLMPVFASEVLHGDAKTLGFLTTAIGIGALGAAASLAMRKTVIGLGRRIMIASAMFGAALIAFSLSRNLYLSLLILPFAGYGMMQQLAGGNTILQTLVDDRKRGRVMAYYSMAFQGIAPFGSLMAGIVAARFGTPVTVAIGGAACIVGSIWFWRQLPAIRAAARPIYQQLGIIPEVATGVQTATALQTPPEQ